MQLESTYREEEVGEMFTFFFINDQNEEGIQGINGLYSSLNSIYQKILEQQFDQTKELKSIS